MRVLAWVLRQDRCLMSVATRQSESEGMRVMSVATRQSESGGMGVET